MKNQNADFIPASVYRAIHFSQPLNLQYLGEFYQIPSLLFSSLTAADIAFLAEKEQNGVSQVLSRLERQLMKQREVLDLSNDNGARLPPRFADHAGRIIGLEAADQLAVYFGFSGCFDLVIKSNRTAVSEIEQVQLTPLTCVKLRSPFLFYSEERYSIALRGSEFSCALVAAPGAGGGKGSARLLIKFLTAEALLIDDAAKYFNTELFLKGINI
ncbi:MAG: hypothetical protein LLG09_06470 [Negativicutes bacterium]|nr:hypothetical protein [Negativicutes bacterium]